MWGRKTLMLNISKLCQTQIEPSNFQLTIVRRREYDEVRQM